MEFNESLTEISQDISERTDYDWSEEAKELPLLEDFQTSLAKSGSVNNIIKQEGR